MYPFVSVPCPLAIPRHMRAALAVAGLDHAAQRLQ
jgi:hypothetical protein